MPIPISFASNEKTPDPPPYSINTKSSNDPLKFFKLRANRKQYLCKVPFKLDNILPK